MADSDDTVMTSSIRTTNPATGEVLRTFEPLTADEVDARLERAATTFRTYRTTTIEQRAAWMHAAADRLDADRASIAATMTTEMGKTLRSAEAEAAKCATAMRFYADHAGRIPGRRAARRPRRGGRQPGGRALPAARRRPRRDALELPALAGRALRRARTDGRQRRPPKHASNVPQCALALEELFAAAGFPEGCFQALLIGSTQVEAVLRDPRVAAATVTGSEPAGRSVASIAGDEVKPTVLELGGSDPFVVMPSADLARAAEVAVTARCQNNGQSCIAAKRFIVHTAVYDTFAADFVGADAGAVRR